ncbi:EAL domain-containing protein [Veronia pacifica]|nr:EAL domain-containing protein [Veronia pacifica]
MNFRSLLNNVFTSFRAAMVSLIPYFFFRSAWIVFIVLNSKYELIPSESIRSIDNTILLVFPILLTITLAYHLSFHFFEERFLVTSMSVTMFFIFSGFITQTETGLAVSDNFVLDDAILIPIITCIGCFLVQKYFKYRLIQSNIVNPLLEGAVNGLIPHVVIFLFLFAFYYLWGQSNVDFFVQFISTLPLNFQAYFHTFIIHLMWLIGIHGASAYYTFFDYSFVSEIYVSNIPFSTFFDVFVIYGGSGSTWALIIAILLFSNMKFARTLAKISIPFAIINVNELLLFGLPIIINPILAIPFVLVPLFNHLFAQVFIDLLNITAVRDSIEWVTPSLIDGALISGGDLKTLLLQIITLMIDILIYMPFVSRYSRNSNDSLLDTLSHKMRFSYSVPERKEVSMFNMHDEVIEHHENLNRSLREILSGDLKMFYQPQFDAHSLKMVGVESLLRLETENALYLPTFIKHFERAKIAQYIDKWVVGAVERDATKHEIFHQNRIKISLNLNVDSIGDTELIDGIIERLSGYPLVFEITETVYANNIDMVNHSAAKLRKAGFEVAIDDFGSGYSCLSMLSSLQADIIKLDHHFLRQARDKKGSQLYSSMVRTLKTLGFTVVAEGVETEDELLFVQSCQVDIIQGFYFSKALSVSELHDFYLKQNIDINNLSF